MTELPPLALPKSITSLRGCRRKHMGLGKGSKQADSSPIHSLAAINFVRSRMFYARAALNARGKVTFGLRHIRES